MQSSHNGPNSTNNAALLTAGMPNLFQNVDPLKYAEVCGTGMTAWASIEKNVAFHELIMSSSNDSPDSTNNAVLLTAGMPNLFQNVDPLKYAGCGGTGTTAWTLT